MNETIEIFGKEANSRACLDIRARFLDRDIIIHSMPHSEINKFHKTVAAFQAVSEGLYLEVLPDGVRIQSRNNYNDDAPVFPSENSMELDRKIANQFIQIPAIP